MNVAEPRERPIIFSGPMVRAILDGTKTQTRRAVKPQPHHNHVLSPAWGFSPDGFEFGEKHLWLENGPDYPDGPEDERRCPYGATGDRLWVRETFHSCPHCPQNSPRGAVYYAAGGYRVGDVSDDRDDRPLSPKCAAHKWRPSIYMPRWASRITLEVTGVRVERLQDISEEDARAEGVTLCEHVTMHAPTHARAFACLWDSINGERPGAAWRFNPWVWVVDLRAARWGQSPGAAKS